MSELQKRPRALATVVERALRAFPVVVVTGARQTGKTTLVRELLPGPPRTFRTLDDLRVLEQAEREPDLLVREGERMTLDEVQRVPDLLRAVKRAVDERRSSGRFLLTGSANLLLMQAVAESLAGRAVYLRLGPLAEGEKRGRTDFAGWNALLGAAEPESALAALDAVEPVRRPWTAAACEGGYPPVLPLAADDRARWFEGYVATYLERDLRQLSDISSLPDFRRLVQAAAIRLGSPLNRAALARDASLAHATAHRYLNLLEVSFQARLLGAFARSRRTRLVKSPKLYWNDTGLAAHLAGIEGPEDLAGELRRGAFLENLLLVHLDAWRETLAPRPDLYHWRTADGIEVDLVIQHRRRLLPVEVKSATRVGHADAGGLERFLADYADAPWGVIAHGGDDLHAVSRRVIAVPVARLLA